MFIVHMRKIYSYPNANIFISKLICINHLVISTNRYIVLQIKTHETFYLNRNLISIHVKGIYSHFYINLKLYFDDFFLQHFIYNGYFVSYKSSFGENKQEWKIYFWIYRYSFVHRHHSIPAL